MMEYMVEIHNAHGFVRQIEVCYTLSEAKTAVQEFCEPLADTESLVVLSVSYDDDDNENNVEVRYANGKWC